MRIARTIVSIAAILLIIGTAATACGRSVDAADPGATTHSAVVDTFKQVSAGGYAKGGVACGVRTNGALACWGNRRGGVPPPPNGKFKQVSVFGYAFACAVRSDGAVACWGHNYNTHTRPPSGRFTEVSAGLDFACGVRVTGNLACWGYNRWNDAKPPSGKIHPREYKRVGLLGRILMRSESRRPAGVLGRQNRR